MGDIPESYQNMENCTKMLSLFSISVNPNPLSETLAAAKFSNSLIYYWLLLDQSAPNAAPIPVDSDFFNVSALIMRLHDQVSFAVVDGDLPCNSS